MLQCNESALWYGYYVNYTVTDTNFTGIDAMKLVAQDNAGVYSEVITVTVAVMEEKCVNGGNCKSKY